MDMLNVYHLLCLSTERNAQMLPPTLRPLSSLIHKTDGIFKPLKIRSPGIDFKESIPPSYEAGGGGRVRQPYSYSVPLPLIDCSNIPAQNNSTAFFFF